MVKNMLDYLTFEPETEAKSCVIWLHGLGADGHDFYSIVPELKLPSDHSIRFIFPHAPVMPVTMNGGMPMPAWFDIVHLSPDAFRDATGIQTASHWVDELVNLQVQQGIPHERIILAGFSQGGAVALYAALSSEKTFAGAMGLSTFLPHIKPLLGGEFRNSQMPIFMAHGQLDPLVLYSIGEATCAELQMAGYQVEWHAYPMQHTVCSQELVAISRWLVASLAL